MAESCSVLRGGPLRFSAISFTWPVTVHFCSNSWRIRRDRSVPILQMRSSATSRSIHLKISIFSTRFSFRISSLICVAFIRFSPLKSRFTPGRQSLGAIAGAHILLDGLRLHLDIDISLYSGFKSVGYRAVDVAVTAAVAEMDTIYK